MSLGDRFCDSRKGGTGGGGWVHPEGANSMAMSGLRGKKVLVGTGRAISIVFGINGVRNLVAVWLLNSSIHRPFFSYSRLPFLGRLDCKSVNWWAWLSHVYA